MPARWPRLPLGSVVLGILALSACTGTAEAKVSVRIDRSLASRAAQVPPLEDGTPRPVGALSLPDGKRISFVENELIVHANPRLRLASLLAAYNATVVRGDAQLGLDPPARGGSPAAQAGRWLLIRIGRPSRRGDLAPNLRRAGVNGTVKFSSEASARTVALFLREAKRSVSLNLRGRLTAISEHPSAVTPSGTTYLDASTWRWMTEDDNAMAPGNQGLSIGVTRAWDYMAYKGVQSGTLINRPFVAIVDGGFNLDANGAPANGNLDYDNTLSPPRQLDVVDQDGKAGGPNLIACSGGASCPWHGTGSFGAAAAYPRNLYGSAGSGGGFIRPLLVRIGTDAFTTADGIRTAALNGAAVISLSLDFRCGTRHVFCALPPDDVYEMVYQSVALARSQRSIVLAAAGNEGDDVGGKDVYPCRTSGVICVGGVRRNKRNAYNYGAPVDISGPGCLRSTVDPGSASIDNNGIGLDELRNFCGTSAATPFVAGIVGLMKAANPSLSTQPILDALQSTANSSPDARVPRGYVDAFRAVEQALPNARPRVMAVSPSSGTLVGWQRHPRLSVAYIDPETPTIEAAYRWRGRVSFRSSRNGLLCLATIPPYACNSMLDALRLGRHRILVRATDAFGATRVARTMIRVVNRRPSVTIGSPATGAPLYSHLPTQLRANVTDQDENVSGITVRWRSSRDGFLGTGKQLDEVLSAGHHVLRAKAVDRKGATATATREVDVRSGTGLPSPQITAPTDTFVSPGEAVTLRGNATDPEDGQLTGPALRWSSNVDGFLGTGNVLTVTLSGPDTPCQPEFVRHTVTLLARDSDGHQVPAEKRISVGALC
jgi:hypothetical protein